MTTDWVVMLASNNFLLVAFIAGLTILGASLLFFRSGLLFIAQLLLLILLLVFGENGPAGIVFSIIQYAVFLFGLYRLKGAIDRSYKLTLEKIHKREPDISKYGNGSRHSFL